MHFHSKQDVISPGLYPGPGIYNNVGPGFYQSFMVLLQTMISWQFTYKTNAKIPRDRQTERQTQTDRERMCQLTASTIKGNLVLYFIINYTTNTGIQTDTTRDRERQRERERERERETDKEPVRWQPAVNDSLLAGADNNKRLYIWLYIFYN